MSSLLQSTGSSPYVLVHTVGQLAATIVTTNIQKTLQPTNIGAEHTYIISKLQMIHNHISTVHPTLADPSWIESSR